MKHAIILLFRAAMAGCSPPRYVEPWYDVDVLSQSGQIAVRHENVRITRSGKGWVVVETRDGLTIIIDAPHVMVQRKPEVERAEVQK